ncbi:MAG: OmpH family outer membrane protein [Firmicutes bacterium]|nr:OmpH family outer membrane protein [Bacillota bacterium]
MAEFFTGKNRAAIIGGVGLLLVLVALGASLSGTKATQKTTVGYVDSDRLLKEYMEPTVMEPLTQETSKLQEELDAEIAKLQIDDENKKLEEAQALVNKYQTVLDQKKRELITPLLMETSESIKRVAETQGITVVLDNTYGFVLYGGVDLTDEVLQDLHAGK